MSADSAELESFARRFGHLDFAVVYHEAAPELWEVTRDEADEAWAPSALEAMRHGSTESSESGRRPPTLPTAATCFYGARGFVVARSSLPSESDGGRS